MSPQNFDDLKTICLTLSKCASSLQQQQHFHFCSSPSSGQTVLSPTDITESWINAGMLEAWDEIPSCSYLYICLRVLIRIIQLPSDPFGSQCNYKKLCTVTISHFFFKVEKGEPGHKLDVLNALKYEVNGSQFTKILHVFVLIYKLIFHCGISYVYNNQNYSCTYCFSWKCCKSVLVTYPWRVAFGVASSWGDNNFSASTNLIPCSCLPVPWPNALVGHFSALVLRCPLWQLCAPQATGRTMDEMVLLSLIFHSCF